MSAPLAFEPVTTLSERIKSKEVSPVDLATEILERIDSYDKHLPYYITVCADAALDAARRAEREIIDGRYRGPLHDIPICHKDDIETEGLLTTGHSHVFTEFVPAHDATIVRRLGAAGAILLGKTNLYELAIGETHIFGSSRNPWDVKFFSGGSSNGSAGAVAAGMSVADTGTDTGGSIRIPASFSGIVGIRPTLTEAFSRYAAYFREDTAKFSSRARYNILSGAFYTSGEHEEASRLRRHWIEELSAVMTRVDALITPATPHPAYTIDIHELGPPDSRGRNTRAFNWSGSPAVSAPCGFTAAGLPIGMQMVGNPLDELTVLRLAHAYEQSTDWHQRRPALEESLAGVRSGGGMTS